jgi:hypothetical protein
MVFPVYLMRAYEWSFDAPGAAISRGSSDQTQCPTLAMPALRRGNRIFDFPRLAMTPHQVCSTFPTWLRSLRTACSRLLRLLEICANYLKLMSPGGRRRAALIGRDFPRSVIGTKRQFAAAQRCVSCQRRTRRSAAAANTAAPDPDRRRVPLGWHRRRSTAPHKIVGAGTLYL